MVFAHYLANYLSQRLHFYMLIGLDENITPVDIEVFKSKVNVRRNTFVKNIVSPAFFLRTIYHKAFICTCNVLISLSEDKTPINFGVHWVKGQGHNDHCCKNNVNMGSAHYFANFFIIGLSYFACRLVLVKTRSLMF